MAVAGYNYAPPHWASWKPSYIYLASRGQIREIICAGRREKVSLHCRERARVLYTAYIIFSTIRKINELKKYIIYIRCLAYCCALHEWDNFLRLLYYYVYYVIMRKTSFNPFDVKISCEKNIIIIWKWVNAVQFFFLRDTLARRRTSLYLLKRMSNGSSSADHLALI